MAVTFHNADTKFTLKQKKELRLFLVQMIKAAGEMPGDLSFVFCSDNYLLEINRRFLNHDYYTDIITFPLSEGAEKLSGEIYISVDRVKENALKFGQNKLKSKKTQGTLTETQLAKQAQLTEGELNRVIFHGVLHLLGYKDKTRTQQSEMRKMEDLWLKKHKTFLQKNLNN